jgi:predicted RNA-binding protein with PUA-like domain
MNKHWLIKSEPESYGIDHLQADGQTAWTGVRNFQARNSIQQMQPGDPVLFYHSSCKVPGVYGLAKVASAPYPDPTQFDPTTKDGRPNHYFDARAIKGSAKQTAKPIWFCVDIAFVQKFTETEVVTLTAIRQNPKLRAMAILRPGSRLSVTLVLHEHYTEIHNISHNP